MTVDPVPIDLAFVPNIVMSLQDVATPTIFAGFAVSEEF